MEKVLGGWRLGGVWHYCWETLQAGRQKYRRRRVGIVSNSDKRFPIGDGG